MLLIIKVINRWPFFMAFNYLSTNWKRNS